MRRLITTLLLGAMLSCGTTAVTLGARGGNRAGREVEAVATSRKSLQNVTLGVDDGSFILADLNLKRAMHSSILEGELVNRTNRALDEVTFEVKAYDREGNLLRGVEEKTIFTASQLEAGASQPLNYGYGVWLQGIPLDAVSRIEIYKASDEVGGAPLLQSIPLVNYVVFSEKYSETEE
ncbi:MAG: hypothetical protein M3362_09110 [Acidobacteriota bacterium]|nr:hypothetical protein [Acidobacteriota bacterium]